MTKQKKGPQSTIAPLTKKEKLYQSMLEHYQIMNWEYCRGLGVFVSDIFEEKKEVQEWMYDKEIADMVERLINGKARPYEPENMHYAIKAGQMAVLYHLDPLRYDKYLGPELMDFLAERFYQRYVYVVGKKGFLCNIVLMNSTKEERSIIQNFFMEHWEVYLKFQYLTSELCPALDGFKLLAQLQDNKHNIKKDIRDVILHFS